MSKGLRKAVTTAWYFSVVTIHSPMTSKYSEIERLGRSEPLSACGLVLKRLRALRKNHQQVAVAILSGTERLPRNSPAGIGSAVEVSAVCSFRTAMVCSVVAEPSSSRAPCASMTISGAQESTVH